jgi:cellulose synthase/poly-beta-1,6-N-acetylglucosamine synthase-like glycosyltransferase
MDSFVELDLSILFLVAVILIWFMIAWQLVLTVYGFFHQMASLKEKRVIDNMEFDYPGVSILIPAHNEELVIAATVESMLALEYPSDRLEVIVINDGSTDGTRGIVESIAARDSRVVLYNVPAGEGGKGKSRALNLGVKQARFDFISVFDADNTPERSSLRYLMAQLLLHEDLGAVIGKFRTVNRKRNLLTRFINIETLSFQSILQAGRWRMLNIATLPGTNYVIRRKIVEDLEGWDEAAITEDSEFSIRMYMHNWKIKIIPYAVTWEQEPETWKVWTRQRTRWVQGNNYVARKFFRIRKELPSRKLRFEISYSLALYYVFFFAIIISDLLFLMAVTNVVVITLPGPYTMVWLIAIVLFFAEIWLALSYDGEDTIGALFTIALMYISYCQLWIFVVARAFTLDVLLKRKQTWVKTERFKREQL